MSKLGVSYISCTMIHGKHDLPDFWTQNYYHKLLY